MENDSLDSSKPNQERITLIIPFLNLGGSQKVVTFLANYWVEHGKQVTILTLGDASVPPFFPLDPRITWVALGVAGPTSNPLAALAGNFRRIFALRKGIRESKPQVAVSFISSANVLSILAMIGLRIPLVISERSDPYKDYLGKAWLLLRRLTYPAANRLVVLSSHYIQFFQPMLGQRVTAIPNPAFPPPQADDTVVSMPTGKIVISVGRLSFEKGYDLLIRAFALVERKYPDWNLLILGEGALRQELERLIVQLGLEGRVFMPGAVENPYCYLSRADLYVLPSRIEGFGMVLCEAMACGLAVVAFDCAAQTSEIVRQGVDGILVPPENTERLAFAMDDMMADDRKRQQFGEMAKEITKRFSVMGVINLWESVLVAALLEEKQKKPGI
jgi:glycosyltransferase involved in cell wall biosynthesis